MSDRMESIKLNKSTILVIDDTPANIHIVMDLLSAEGFRVLVAEDGEEGIETARAGMPDLILLDAMMPGIDGYETCRRLKADPATREIPVIFLTALSQTDQKLAGFDAGGADYVTKPLQHKELLARIRTQLENQSARKILRGHNAALEREVAHRTQELSAMQDAIIQCMASLAETRDNETGNHIRRTQHYVKMLAVALKDHPRFAATLTGNAIEQLYKSAPLHDIGKVGIPDAILLKPDKLTAAEFEIMKTHTTLGRDTLLAAERMLDNGNSFLKFAREIAYSHQEKWDGSGYPQGLAGDAIPVSARLMALADVYDALISKRVYKPAFTHEHAMEIILAGRGTHFDPDIVGAFEQFADEFQSIAQRFRD
ncbi:MAG: response regulator receiver modulated metal dependent phosphohydrolase [Herbaspirillum sp.]|jgi:putative two-component system response regulator|nr:response regulator receiver modulated metal dependent phosphohydrolase [Herbaspirillum sp.]